MKTLVVGLASILLIPAAVCGQVKAQSEKSIPASSPSISLPQKQTIKANKSITNGTEPLSSGAQTLELKHQYTFPILNNIWSEPISCKKVNDDEKSYQKLEISYKQKDTCSGPLKYDAKDESPPDYFTPDFERLVEKQNIICSAWPTRATYKSFADIWKDGPCSQAGIVSLILIDGMLFNNYDAFLRAGYYNNDNFPYMAENYKTLQYIIDNYPICWETEFARYLLARRLYEWNSEEQLAAAERWVKYVEDNSEVLHDRYYLLLSGEGNSVEDFRRFDKGELSRMYLERCSESAREGISKNGKMPPEAIEMYNRHRKLIENDKKLFPKYYKKMEQFPGCYKYIEKYAPSEVKHSKSELAHPEKEK